MRLSENIRMAWSALRARKLRSALTLLGIVIGVASVISVASIIDGLNRGVQAQVEVLGARTYYVMRTPMTANPLRMPERLRKRRHLEYEYGQLLREMCPSLEAVSVGASRTAQRGDRNEMRFGSQLVERVLLRGAEPDYANASPMFMPAQGRFINADDLEKRRPVVVIGASVAGALFPAIDPLGRQVRLNGRVFEVIGVLEAAGAALVGTAVDDTVVIPITTFRKEYPEIRDLVLSVSLRSGVPREQGMEELVQAMRRIRRVAGKAPNDFDIASSDYLSVLWSQLTSALVVLATLLSSIGLIVGGLGVMNIMLISVTERTAEIGVRKAIGARRNDIRVQFLLEATMMSICGGLIGVVVGALIAWVVRGMYPSVQATLSYQWVAIGVAVSAGIGLVFGFLPANRAAGLDPIVCLRYE